MKLFNTNLLKKYKGGKTQNKGAMAQNKGMVNVISSNSLLLGSELNVNIKDLSEKSKDIQEILLFSFLNIDLVNLKYFDFFSLKKVHSIVFEKIKGAISVYLYVNCCPK